MAYTFWRRLRFLMGGSAKRGPANRVPIRRAGRAGGDTLVDGLLRLRKVVEVGALGELAMAWFRVDEAKANAVWYDCSREPACPAVLPEEEALAERLYQHVTGRPPSPAALLSPTWDAPLAMVRYRLLAARLPGWCAIGGRRAGEAIAAAYQLMASAPEVLSPYGRWLLARAVCLAARDDEELARQTERFRMVTADYRAPDGASMAFISGGEYELPVPVSVTEVLDWPSMPTRPEALKKDAPPEVRHLILGLTPRGRRVFLRAFQRRAEAYRGGTPWRKPAWLTSEGHVFVRMGVQLPAFFIDRRPVTNAMYLDFIGRHPLWLPSRVTPYAVDRDTYLPTWQGDAPAYGTAAEAVTGVSYQACCAYTHACGKQLPTEAQWLYALVGPEMPETRYYAGEGRPSMSGEERAVYARRAAEHGLHIVLPERLSDLDGAWFFSPGEGGRVVHRGHGRGAAGAHVWRTPTARGRVPDLAGDANLSFRGVISAGQLWARQGERSGQG